MEIGNGEEKKLSKNLKITGTGAITANVLQVFGTVRVTEQYATITGITTLVNATAVYSTAYDGTNTIELTDDGIVLSGAPVGTFFVKDKATTEVYSLNTADQVRINEVVFTRNSGKPFNITQKNGTNTYIRLHLTTTDNPVDFTVNVVFKYIPLSPGASLIFL